MGSLIYGIAGTVIDIEDRELAHLRVVMLSKLRRGESFSFTVNHAVHTGSGRTSLWMHSAIPLAFRFAGNRPIQLNREWVELLSEAAHRPDGLNNLPEPAASSLGQ